MRRIIWIINTVLIIGYFILRFSIGNIKIQNDIIAELLSILFPILILGLIIGLILALIPFKSKGFKEKIASTIPIGISIMIAVLSLNLIFNFRNLNDLNLIANLPYNEIEIPQNLNCSEIKKGFFESDNLIIERKENKQFQTDKISNKLEVYDIDWKSNCEYILTSIDDKTIKIKVKIIQINELGYNCYYTVDQYAIPLRFKKIKNGS